MDLYMYLYRATKKNIENLNHLKEVENDLNKMWSPIIEHEFPKNLDKSKMTEQQRKLVDERNYEFDIIDQKRLEIRDEFGGYIEYWRNFNTLHNYIVDNFADGVDNRHEIPLTKDNAVQILNYLNHIVDVLSSLTMVLTEDGNYYYYKCEIPDEIKLPLVLIQSDGCFFGKISIYKSFVHEITKSIDIFSLIVREWDDDHVVWYKALW